jgi:hypothetical protein
MPTVDFEACCGDPEPEPDPVPDPAPDPNPDPAPDPDPVSDPAPDPAPELNLQLPVPIVRVALSPEEEYLKQWHDESTRECAEEFVWIDCDREDGVKIHFTEERLREIGIPAECGHLYWIQDKPEGMADKFGHWDPINARWRLLVQHTVSQIEQRIAPLGVGYGSTDTGGKCCENDSFLSHEYNPKVETYESTALESGLNHISSQLRDLPHGTCIPIASGWGETPSDKYSYYTPHLRHVFIDQSVQEEDGKRYVYTPGCRPVKPVAVAADWSSANSCWVVHGQDKCNSLLEREADGILAGRA